MATTTNTAGEPPLISGLHGLQPVPVVFLDDGGGPTSDLVVSVCVIVATGRLSDLSGTPVAYALALAPSAFGDGITMYVYTVATTPPNAYVRIQDGSRRALRDMLLMTATSMHSLQLHGGATPQLYRAVHQCMQGDAADTLRQATLVECLGAAERGVRGTDGAGPFGLKWPGQWKTIGCHLAEQPTPPAARLASPACLLTTTNTDANSNDTMMDADEWWHTVAAGDVSSMPFSVGDTAPPAPMMDDFSMASLLQAFGAPESPEGTLLVQWREHVQNNMGELFCPADLAAMDNMHVFHCEGPVRHNIGTHLLGLAMAAFTATAVYFRMRAHTMTERMAFVPLPLCPGDGTGHSCCTQVLGFHELLQMANKLPTQLRVALVYCITQAQHNRELLMQEAGPVVSKRHH
jgi:hypothetical protein